MMTAIASKPQRQPAAPATARSHCCGERPAAIAAARISRAGLFVGGLGLASTFWVVATLLDSWRVGGGRVQHLTMLGLRMSYPAANVAGLLVLLMAAVGAIVLVR